MNAALARIIVRYVAAALAGAGLFTDTFGQMLATDQDVIKLVQIGVPMLVGIITEWWYVADRVKGKTT